MSAIAELTPHMSDYASHFADSGIINWRPYLMYFHPYSYNSNTVSTDEYGFRYSEARGSRYSVPSIEESGPVRLIAGSSTVFGIGASSDRHTLASRLTENDTKAERWVNFGGRSFNSTQELLLFTLYRHRLPRVEEIVLFSGFNDLGLARLPQSMRGEHGAFFMCQDYFNLVANNKNSIFTSWFRTRTENLEAPISPTIDEQISIGADLTIRHLDVWRALAADLGAKLTYVLQPLANWVRDTGSPEEERIFAELERRGAFASTYGDILAQDSYREYATRLRKGTKKLGVQFVDFTPLLANAAGPAEWLFVDRIHFTDGGYDFASKLLLEAIRN
jgi:hypothetical protein